MSRLPDYVVYGDHDELSIVHRVCGEQVTSGDAPMDMQTIITACDQHAADHCPGRSFR